MVELKEEKTTTPEQTSTPEFAKEFTDQELEQLEDLVYHLASPESEKDAVAPTWKELSRPQQELLIKRYGPPRRVNREVRVTEYTSGEGCADNERGLPDSFDSHNFGVWDKSLLVFALYGTTPHVESNSKLRILPAGLVIGSNDRVLLPDFFYTPAGKLRRELVIAQMNHNPRGDKSVRMAEAYTTGELESDGLILTIYRRLGSRTSLGDTIKDSNSGRVAMEKLGIKYLDHDNPLNKYRQVIDVNKLIQQDMTEIVVDSNLYLIQKAFKESKAIKPFKLRPTAVAIDIRDIETGQDSLLMPRQIEREIGTFSAVPDPTWQYGNESRPLVYRYQFAKDGKALEKFVYIGNRDALEEV